MLPKKVWELAFNGILDGTISDGSCFNIQYVEDENLPSQKVLYYAGRFSKNRLVVLPGWDYPSEVENAAATNRISGEDNTQASESSDTSTAALADSEKS